MERQTCTNHLFSLRSTVSRPVMSFDTQTICRNCVFNPGLAESLKVVVYFQYFQYFWGGSGLKIKIFLKLVFILFWNKH